MTKEELLAKARRDYPAGTEFLSPYQAHTDRKMRKSDVRLHDDDKNVIAVDGGFYLYYEGKWGEITKRVQPQELPIFN